jgi:hypothetical protein
MAGEAIEDLRIETVKFNDIELKKRYFYTASEDQLKEILDA